MRDHIEEGRIFHRGGDNVMWRGLVGSNAVGCTSRADAVIDFCIVNCSGDSQCFTVGRTTPKFHFPLGDLERNYGQEYTLGDNDVIS